MKKPIDEIKKRIKIHNKKELLHRNKKKIVKHEENF